MKRIRLLDRGGDRGDLDSHHEAMISAAFDDATQRGIDRICLFLSWEVSGDDLRTLLGNPRVASVGVKDRPFESPLPPDLRCDVRVGRYLHPGGWILPAEAEHVYFVGSWRLLSRDMVHEAVRRQIRSLRVRVRGGWRALPLARFHAAGSRFQRLPAPLKVALHSGLRMFSNARARGPFGPWPLPMDQALRRMVDGIEPRSDFVPGRIVLVCGNLAPGGAERQTAYTLTGLAHCGLESIHLLSHYLDSGPQRHDFYLPMVRRAGVMAREIRRTVVMSETGSLHGRVAAVVESLPAGFAIDIANLVKEFEELKPEVVHAWLDWDNTRAGLAAAIAGVPRIVVSGRNINPSHFALHQPYMDPSYRALASVPQVTMINNSRAGADDYADWIGISRSRIQVIYNSVDFGDRTRLPPDDVRRRREALGIPHDALVVGGMFRLAAEKRPMLWLDAAAIVARRRPDAYFLIFGQGDLRNEMIARAEAFGIANRVLLAGVTDDVLSALSLMDIFMLTSYGEGLPNVLLEAQWAGVPVVTTDAGGAREAVDQGVTGWVVETAKPADLSATVLRLADDKDLCARMLLAAPRFVKTKFGFARMIRETLDVYALTPQRRGPTQKPTAEALLS